MILLLDIKELVKKNFNDLQSLRRHFHENPELSGKEFQTMDFIEKKLDEYGIPHLRVENGGIFAWIDGAGQGKTILLRADIDALPIKEDGRNLCQNRACISKNNGVMHACGHDGHIAMQLIEAKLLNELKHTWDGKVIFMFEEGEESTAYIKPLLEYLELESDWKIDTCYATHVRWDIPAGKIAVLHGPAMAGGFGFKINIHGHGGHGSRPDLANSPIDCFTSFYHDLQALRMRAISPLETITVSLGTVQAGDAYNVIPNDLYFAGSSRFFSYDKAGKIFFESIEPMLARACETYNCTYEIVHMKKPLYEAYNNEFCADLAEKAITKYIGADTLYNAEPWMASETFALTQRLYPGLLTFTGIMNKEKGTGANHHTPEFDIDEDGLATGVEAAMGYVLDYLAEKPEIPFERNIISLDDLTSRNL